MKTNVLEFLPNIEDGGVQKVVSNYCKYINKVKFNIFVLTLFPLLDSNCYKTIKNNNCSVESILKIIRKWDSSIIIRSFKRLISVKYISFKLKQIIKKKKINVIHAHLDVLQYINTLSKFLKKRNIKILYTCHSIPERWLGSRYFEEHNAAKELIKNQQMIIYALHQRMADEINKMFNISSTKILENPIEIVKFSNIRVSKKDVRDRLKINQHDYVICDVCRLIQSKNLLFLVDIFKECHNIDNSCFLLLICQGNKELKKVINEKINAYNLNGSFLLIENASDINVLLKAADVFCSPSLIEGFSVSLLEAQCSGLNCVYSDINPPEINLMDNNIVLSYKDEAKRWANSIMSLKGKIGKLQPAINNYTIESVIKKVEALYKN